MPPSSHQNGHAPKGHALRNFNLRKRSLARSAEAPPLARMAVQIRADALGMTRLEFSRCSGISRGTLRDFELGVHKPTRQTLGRFIAFCQRRRVDRQHLEALEQEYAGSRNTLEQFIARLELRSGSARELARRVNISTSTLWEYRRGNFPLPWRLCEKFCRAVGEPVESIEAIWKESHRRRLIDRGYPEAWAELCVWCARAGRSESYLLKAGMSTATLRQLGYLELPNWEEVAKAARTLAPGAAELQALKQLWQRNVQEQRQRAKESFGAMLKQLREARGVSRRELADLFEIGGKKPARIIKYIEEDGYYSVQAFPAGLVAALTDDPAVEQRLLEAWKHRRRQFTARRRPETRVELRLIREMYGFDFGDLKPVLGYSSLEYQKIERGVEALLDTARDRILEALHEAGRQRVEELLARLAARRRQRLAWRNPPTVTALISTLAQREGGLAPLARRLAEARLSGVSIPRLRAISTGQDVPPWRLLERIGEACDVTDLLAVRGDWKRRYRAALERQNISPLAVELRLLIAETAPTVRAFSQKLPFNYSVLVRDLQRIDRNQPLKWFHVERILDAAGVRSNHERWQEIRILWYTVNARSKKGAEASSQAS
jgi:transcriptional regulator with XRE-family HTH domain